MNLYDNIESLKGVGAKTTEGLNKCGIYTIMDLLLYFPRDYERISVHDRISNSKDDEKVTIECTVKEILKDVRTKGGKLISTVVFDDGNTIFKGKWFNQPYKKNNFKIFNRYCITGKVKIFNNEKIMVNPIISNKYTDAPQKMMNNEVVVIPKYPLKGKITNTIITKLISQVLSQIHIEDNLPEWIIDKYAFCSLDKAIRAIHDPNNMSTLDESLKRLKFQELFSYSLKMLMLKEYLSSTLNGIQFKISNELQDLKNKLPFQLTEAQNRTMREILIDQKKNIPMNRLIQGDVGSGKTVIAIIAMFNVVKNGYQAALMAPTEILASQHFHEAVNLLMDFGIKVELLTGSTTQKNKNAIKESLKKGDIQIIIGTHSLLEDDVEFNNLGLVVTDEQHRFGVTQRSRLFNKSNNIDVLVMTATPIPRTLALYLYGDLNVSIIDELPPGRQKIETYYVNETQRDRVYNFALKEINDGRQVYIVCPLVEDNEELALQSVEKLFYDLKDNYFLNIDIEMLHGKMPPKQKEEIMTRFKNGETKAVVSTTVIEVGINVPNATLMIIENAERFGLAQLHQLRGRVGRGKFKSYCILVANVKNDVTKKRMEIMQSSNDGFYIAEQDLKIRGGGELLGFRQHGEDNLVLSDVIEDINILKQANFEAKKLLQSTNQDDEKVKSEILKSLEKSSKFICFN